MRRKLPSSDCIRYLGDHHAQEVLRLDDDDGRHCRGRWQRGHFGARDTGVGSGSGSFRRDARRRPPLKTAWGEPDLQGIWTDETDHAAAAARQVREPGILHRGGARRIGPGAIGSARPRKARGARHRARRLGLLQQRIRVLQADRRAHVADRRSAQRPDAAADAGGPEARRRRAGVSSRAAAIDRDLQEQGGRLQRREIRSDALAAICRTCRRATTPRA